MRMQFLVVDGQEIARAEELQESWMNQGFELAFQGHQVTILATEDGQPPLQYSLNDDGKIQPWVEPEPYWQEDENAPDADAVFDAKLEEAL